MKDILKDVVIRSIVVFIIWGLLIYALFSFIQYDLNAGNWNMSARLLCGLLCIPFGIFITIMFNMFLDL